MKLLICKDTQERLLIISLIFVFISSNRFCSVGAAGKYGDFQSFAAIIKPRQIAPSSKICHVCGHKLDELSLKVREWDCPSCGIHHDREMNAPLNLESVVSTTASSVGSNACGEDVRPEAIQADLDEAGTELQSAMCRFVLVSENGRYCLAPGIA